jgi:hypothetical protein
MAMARHSILERAPRLILLLMVLAIVGEAGHQVLDQLNFDLGHHIFHIVFPLIAFAVFALFVARDVRRNGWPRFSWRLT